MVSQSRLQGSLPKRPLILRVECFFPEIPMVSMNKKNILFEQLHNFRVYWLKIIQ